MNTFALICDAYSKVLLLEKILLICYLKSQFTTLEPSFNEPLHNNACNVLHPSNSKIYGKIPLYNKTSL